MKIDMAVGQNGVTELRIVSEMRRRLTSLKHHAANILQHVTFVAYVHRDKLHTQLKAG